MEVTREELEANCIFMILAATETTATSLLSATNFLCKDPQVSQKLNEEVGKFGEESDLKLSNLSSLPYLNANIREAYRVCPPLANATAHVVGPDRAVICGQSIPPGVSTSLYSDRK